MSDVHQLLNTTLSDLVKSYNIFQLSTHSTTSIKTGTEIISTGMAIVSMLKSHIKSIEYTLSECQDFINDMSDDLSQQPREEDYVYHTANGMLSYIGRELIEKKMPSPQHNTTVPLVNNIYIKEIDYHMKLPQVTSLKQIPPMFYYMKNAIYCQIYTNVYLQVPFSELADSLSSNKERSVRCKYKTRAMCSEQRGRMAKYHATTTRTCNFAHTGEEIVRIGYPSRCATIPSFGNPQTLTKDMSRIDADDIKNILLYGLSDCFTAAVWLDYNKVTQLGKLNIC